MRVRFTANYDHTWPSGATTHYRAGYEGTVKQEVGERAKRLGRAEDAEAPVAEGDEGEKTLPENLDPVLAEPQALTPNLHVDAKPKRR